MDTIRELDVMGVKIIRLLLHCAFLLGNSSSIRDYQGQDNIVFRNRNPRMPPNDLGAGAGGVPPQAYADPNLLHAAAANADAPIPPVDPNAAADAPVPPVDPNAAADAPAQPVNPDAPVPPVDPNAAAAPAAANEPAEPAVVDPVAAPVDPPVDPAAAPVDPPVDP